MPQAEHTPDVKFYSAHPDAGQFMTQFTSELAAGGELEPLLERFLISIVALAGAQAGAVRILTADGQFMRLVAQQGLPSYVLSAELQVDRHCGMCGVAAGVDVLGWVDDVRSCSRHTTDDYFGNRCKRILAISLPHGKEVLGIYNLFFEGPADLSPLIQTMLRLIGQLLGLALHNARIERERLRSMVMKERQEMVNEVHDAIAQTLAYVKMRLPLLSDAMLDHDDQRSLKYFSDVKKAVGDVHDSLRAVMTDFRIRMDPLGLLHAVRAIANGFHDRTGITLELHCSTQHLNLTDEQELQVFHIIQEALANITKHSMARHAVLTIHKEARQMEVMIDDDGLGIVQHSPGPISKEVVATTHFGLEIMRGRAQRMGGTLNVGENEDGGTRVHLVIPVSAVSVGFCT